MSKRTRVAVTMLAALAAGIIIGLQIPTLIGLTCQ